MLEGILYTKGDDYNKKGHQLFRKKECIPAGKILAKPMSLHVIMKVHSKEPVRFVLCFF